MLQSSPPLSVRCRCNIRHSVRTRRSVGSTRCAVGVRSRTIAWALRIVLAQRADPDSSEFVATTRLLFASSLGRLRTVLRLRESGMCWRDDANDAMGYSLDSG